MSSSRSGRPTPVTTPRPDPASESTWARWLVRASWIRFSPPSLAQAENLSCRSATGSHPSGGHVNIASHERRQGSTHDIGSASTRRLRAPPGRATRHDGRELAQLAQESAPHRASPWRRLASRHFAHPSRSDPRRGPRLAPRYGRLVSVGRSASGLLVRAPRAGSDRSHHTTSGRPHQRRPPLARVRSA